MLDAFSNYWPYIFLTVSLTVGAVAAAHAAMTKDDVRAATGWVGVILLSPMLGAFFYLIAGINRIRHTALATRRTGRRTFEKQSSEHALEREQITAQFGRQFRALNILGDTLTRFFMTTGNSVTMLETGDQAYSEICEAIDTAERSIILESYIFDCDEIGRRVAGHLLRAQARGINVRVLIDAVGARYSVPSIVKYLRNRGLQARTFNGNVIMGLRLPYANLRTHRKIIVIDEDVAFTGGMNIREAFTSEFAGDKASLDTHFKVTGPVVGDLFAVVAEDWHFASGERLEQIVCSGPDGDDAPLATYARVVSSGPDGSLETNHKMLMGAFSVAQSSIRIMSPYFLPDRELVSALTTAARRGVRIDIVVPLENNLKLVDLAMTAQFDQVLKNGCHVWRVAGTFNHSKLLTIDGNWSYVGTSNLDPRSLRLNFEVDLEILDNDFAELVESRIDAAIAEGTEVMLGDISNQPFLLRLLGKVIWLGSPYL
ncbi:MAG: Phospholipase D/Transphosphatidylase [Rhizobium sp.]|nr:Phospholipase D/Transphosphatidylase [Rhizobium sp.]